VAYHPTKAGKAKMFGEMQNIAENKAFFIE